MIVTWLILGFVGSIALAAITHFIFPKWEKLIWSVILIAAALVYVDFARDNEGWLWIEVAGVALYSLFVWAAYRYASSWLVVGWLLHPVWDIGVHWFGPGRAVVDEWYTIACFSFDLFAAAYLYYKLSRVG